MSSLFRTSVVYSFAAARIVLFISIRIPMIGNNYVLQCISYYGVVKILRFFAEENSLCGIFKDKYLLLLSPGVLGGQLEFHKSLNA